MELDVSFNLISNTRGLNGLNLRFLNMNNNEITEIEDEFESLTELMILLINRNFIANLEHLRKLQKLRVLDLGNNKISAFNEIENLQDLLFLSEIDLCHNPIQERK